VTPNEEFAQEISTRYFFSQFWKEISFEVLKNFHKDDSEETKSKFLAVSIA
jgi:hypothetical protein